MNAPFRRTPLSNFAVIIAAFVFFHAAPAQEFEPQNVDGMQWWKGNTHTHTTNSDGDSPPDTVAWWYKRNGYRFLVLTDHNVFTDPATLRHLVDSTFLLISGEELTSSFEKKPVHVNGLHIPHLLEPQTDSTLVGTIQQNVDAVRGVKGVPHINHPNFGWAFDHEVLQHVERDKLLEIYNGHPLVHNHGGGGRPGLEAIWDSLLTRGKRMYGIAVDDAHHFKGEFNRHRSNPGKGWVCVRAHNLDARELMTNLEEGLFYASTGVELEDVRVGRRSLEVVVKQRGSFRHTIEFIGDGGKVLKWVDGERGVYELDGALSYVRAKVTDSMGYVAWVQPVFVRK